MGRKGTIQSPLYCDNDREEDKLTIEVLPRTNYKEDSDKDDKINKDKIFARGLSTKLRLLEYGSILNNEISRSHYLLDASGELKTDENGIEELFNINVWDNIELQNVLRQQNNLKEFDFKTLKFKPDQVDIDRIEFSYTLNVANVPEDEDLAYPVNTSIKKIDISGKRHKGMTIEKPYDQEFIKKEICPPVRIGKSTNVPFLTDFDNYPAGIINKDGVLTDSSGKTCTCQHKIIIQVEPNEVIVETSGVIDSSGCELL